MFGNGDKVKTVRNSDGSIDRIQTKIVVTRKPDGTKVTKRKIIRSRTPNPADLSGGLGSSHHSNGSSSSGNLREQGSMRRCKTPTTGVPNNALERMKGSLRDMQVKKHTDDASFEQAVIRCIPSEFLLIASQDEVTQAQEDYYAMDHYDLPALDSSSSHGGGGSPRNKNSAGSVATCALLELCYENPKRMIAPKGGETAMDCQQVLQRLQKRIQQASKIDNAKPTISSSRVLGPPRMPGGKKYAPFTLVSPKATGTRRALLIGVVSGGRDGGLLKAPPNDVRHMQKFLTQHGGFKEENITVLLEDPKAPPEGKTQPTKANILAAFAKLVRTCRSNDSVVVQYSGHGGRLTHNLYIVPSDFTKSTGGPIRDEDIMKLLIKAMPAHVHTTMIMDCCFSGTLGDLPYVLKSGATEQEIEIYFDTDTRAEMMQKERQGGEAYQKYKQNRANQRFLMNLSPMKLVEDAAAATAAAAQATAAAATAAGAAGLDAAKKTSAVAADAAKKTSAVAADAAKKTSAVAADAAKKTSAVASDAAKRTSAAASDAAKRTSAAASDAAKRTSAAAGTAAASARDLAGGAAASARDLAGGAALAAGSAATSARDLAYGYGHRLSNAASSMSDSLRLGDSLRFGSESFRFGGGDSMRFGSDHSSQRGPFCGSSTRFNDDSMNESIRSGMTLGTLDEDEDGADGADGADCPFKKDSSHHSTSTASTASTSTVGSAFSTMSNVAKGGAHAAMGGVSAMSHVAKGGATAAMGSAKEAMGNATAAMRRGVARCKSGDGSKPLFRTKSSEDKDKDNTEEDSSSPKRRAGRRPIMQRVKSSDGTANPLARKPMLRTTSADDSTSAAKKQTPSRANSSDGMMSTMPMTRRAGKKPASRTKSGDGSTNKTVSRTKSNDGGSPIRNPLSRNKSSDGGIPIRNPLSRNKSSDGGGSSPKASPIRNTLSRNKSNDGGSSPKARRGRDLSPTRSKGFRGLPGKTKSTDSSNTETAEDVARREAVERSRREAAEARAAARMQRV